MLKNPVVQHLQLVLIKRRVEVAQIDHEINVPGVYVVSQFSKLHGSVDGDENGLQVVMVVKPDQPRHLLPVRHHGRDCY